jgi:hypothetical protein|tara:strand:- start:1582 stop:1731 length:150 start_codon:yes stop_codon:yes gene_type:complete
VQEDLNSKEWQLYLVLEELEGTLTNEEKHMKLGKWVRKKIEELEKRTGW